MRTEERSGASSPSFSSKRRRRERDWLPGLAEDLKGCRLAEAAVDSAAPPVTISPARNFTDCLLIGRDPNQGLLPPCRLALSSPSVTGVASRRFAMTVAILSTSEEAPAKPRSSQTLTIRSSAAVTRTTSRPEGLDSPGTSEAATLLRNYAIASPLSAGQAKMLLPYGVAAGSLFGQGHRA
nr:unnamed protein product [Digitaria exilis]